MAASPTEASPGIYRLRRQPGLRPFHPASAHARRRCTVTVGNMRRELLRRRRRDSRDYDLETDRVQQHGASASPRTPSPRSSAGWLLMGSIPSRPGAWLARRRDRSPASTWTSRADIGLRHDPQRGLGWEKERRSPGSRSRCLQRRQEPRRRPTAGCPAAFEIAGRRRRSRLQHHTASKAFRVPNSPLYRCTRKR